MAVCVWVCDWECVCAMCAKVYVQWKMPYTATTPTQDVIFGHPMFIERQPGNLGQINNRVCAMCFCSLLASSSSTSSSSTINLAKKFFSQNESTHSFPHVIRCVCVCTACYVCLFILPFLRKCNVSQTVVQWFAFARKCISSTEFIIPARFRSKRLTPLQCVCLSGVSIRWMCELLNLNEHTHTTWFRHRWSSTK